MNEANTIEDAGDQIGQLLARVSNLEKECAALRARVASADGVRGQRLFLARANGTNGAWAEVYPDSAGSNAAMVDFVDGRADTVPAASTVNGTNVVRAMLALRLAGAMQYVPLPAGVILVSLTKTSGSDGTTTAAATYKYDVKAAKVDRAGSVTPGQTLRTDVAPVFGRAFGQRSQASVGLAYEASDGGYVLLYAHEPETTTTTCS